MYQEGYKKDEQDDMPREGERPMGQTESGAGEQPIDGAGFTMRDPESARSGESGQPGADAHHGAGQPGMNAPYGTGQSGMGVPYRPGQPGMGTAYGTGQPGTDRTYGAGQPGVNAPYGSQQYGGQYGGRGSFGPGQPGTPHYAPWQQPQTGAGEPEKKPAKAKGPHPLLKKAAGITAAALLFGAVAGGTISGISLLADHFSGRYELEETQATLAQAETVPPIVSQTPAAAGDGGLTVTPAITNDVSAIVEKAMPSVVAINSLTEQEYQNWFGQTQIYQGKGSGSGIIVGESDSELLIVTNNHVIQGATELGVVFVDDESVEAHIKGTDSENDLAVIAVALDKIPDSTKSRIAVATLGDSDHLKVGQGVIAIGNALGYGQAVTVGYVSALDREVQTDQETTRNLLQTDAAINPGNSGGALLNMQGEVIGINSAKYSSTEVEGMGYAIPISKVHDIIDDLMTKKTRVQVEASKQGYLGLQGQDIDATASNLYDMPQGVYVYRIIEGGAAASSDLKKKDIITRFDGQSVRSMAELKNMLTYYAGGDTIELTVQSLADGRYVERKVEITLGMRTE